MGSTSVGAVMGGGFPIDLVLFGMVAVFLVLRLVSILGKRTGFERPAERVMPDGAPGAGPRMGSPVIDAVAEAPAPSGRVVPDLASPALRTGLDCALLAQGLGRSGMGCAPPVHF